MAKETTEFTGLLKPNYNDALKYSRALCSTWSPDDAEDVLQQSLLLALENFDKLNDRTKFRSWFFKIITTTFYSSIRKHFWKKFLPLDSMDHLPHIPEVFDRSEQTESRLILNKALSKLSAKERAAILLFEIAEFSIEEITSIQKDKSISAVKSRLSRARAKLKKYILNEEEHYSRHGSAGIDNHEGSNYTEDLELETIKLIPEIRVER